MVVKGRRSRGTRLLARLRRQTPVHSPLPLRAILAAIRASIPTSNAAAIRASFPTTNAPRNPATGDPRDRLSARLQADYGARACVLTGSGTDALRIALEIVGEFSGGAPVALPAFACYDVATAAVGAGTPVAFYDVDPATLSPDLDSLEHALRAGARSIVFAPLYGMPIDWAAAAELARRYGATIVEDAAQGHGACWCGRPLGSLGTLAVLSFGRGKGWTGGRGGALLLGPDADPDLAAYFALRTGDLSGDDVGPISDAAVFLAALAQCTLARPALYALPHALPGLHLGRTVYRDPTPPRPMPRAAAAILEATRDDAAAEAAVRRRNARRYLEALAPGGPATPIHPPQGAAAGYLRLPIRHSAGLPGLADPRAAERLGIAPSYPMPLPSLPPMRPLLAAPPAPHPGAATLARQLVTLPTHSRLTAAEQQEVLRLIHTRRF